MIFKLVREFEVCPDVSVKKKSYYFKVYLNEEYQFPNKQEVLHSYTYEHQRLGSAATNTSLSRVPNKNKYAHKFFFFFFSMCLFRVGKSEIGKEISVN